MTTHQHFAALHKRQQERREAGKFGVKSLLAFRGRQAFEAGTCPTLCPFALDTPEQRAWIAGWMTGFDRKYNGF
jgi:ribosome modulation factor